MRFMKMGVCTIACFSREHTTVTAVQLVLERACDPRNCVKLCSDLIILGMHTRKKEYCFSR